MWYFFCHRGIWLYSFFKKMWGARKGDRLNKNTSHHMTHPWFSRRAPRPVKGRESGAARLPLVLAERGTREQLYLHITGGARSTRARLRLNGPPLKRRSKARMSERCGRAGIRCHLQGRWVHPSAKKQTRAAIAVCLCSMIEERHGVVRTI